jgi:hypothetical protein
LIVSVVLPLIRAVSHPLFGRAFFLFHTRSLSHRRSPISLGLSEMLHMEHGSQGP